MKQIKLLIIMASVFLLSGCTLLQPGLSIDPEAVEVAVEEVVTFSIAGSGEITARFGDDSAPVPDSVDGIVVFKHVYTQAGIFTATFTKGRSVATSVVTVTAPGFTLNPPHESGSLNNEFYFIGRSLSPRTIECDPESGEYDYQYGLWPDNLDDYMTYGSFGRRIIDYDQIDADFEMYIRVINADDSRGYAYRGMDIVNDKWIPFGVFGLFVNWGYAAPYNQLPYAFFPKSCDDSCGTIDQDDPFVMPEEAQHIRIQVNVRSKYGVEKSVSWYEYFIPHTCN